MSIKGYHSANVVVFMRGGLHPYIPRLLASKVGLKLIFLMFYENKW